MPYLPDNRQFKRRHRRVHIEAPTIHLSAHGSHFLMWIAIGLLLTAGMVYLGRMIYMLDREHAHKNQEKIESVVDDLQQKIVQVESDRDALRQSVATLERAAQIDEVAQREVQEELIALQEERSKLEQEVSVLKRVTGKSKGGTSARSKGAAPARSRKQNSGSSKGSKKKKINSKVIINKKLPASGGKTGNF